MLQRAVVPPNLEERFTEPQGFRWHSFERNGRKIRFGSISPKDSVPDAVVVCLPGLSEYGEKYYEVARDLNDKNLAFWVIDWMGQGASGRYLPNHDKRHAANFDEDIEDLHYLILEYIVHSSVSPDVGRIPLAMLAHSMGGNIGLRYMQKYPDTFECGGFSAPMLNVAQLDMLPLPIAIAVSGVMKLFAGSSYSFGQNDWNESLRPEDSNALFSTDKQRSQLHEQWFRANPHLRVGGVTNSWVYEALRSCLAASNGMNSLNKEIFVGYAGNETIVSNKAIRKVFEGASFTTLKEFPGAGHELLMERDDIRTPFLNDFYNLVQKTIIDNPDTLKPF